ncbi:MAG: NAD(+) synthase [Clostridiales bacterium]
MNYGFIKIAAAVPKTKISNCEYNSDIIIKLIIEAENKKCQIIVFPELSVTSYTSADLFHQDLLIESGLKYLNIILEKTKRLKIVSILGLPIRFKNSLYNCGVIICRGKILGIVPKTHIPCYKEFYEDRWFNEGKHVKGEYIDVFGEKIPFGVDLLFRDKNNLNLCFSVEICEDLWMPIPPSSVHAINGALITFNLSASNEIIGKYEYRRNLVKQQSARCLSSYVYTSSGVYESTTDIVFSGHALICENGSIISESKRYDRDDQIVIGEIDIERLINERNKMTTFSGLENEEFRYTEFDINRIDFKELNRFIDPHPFVPNDDFMRNKRCEEIFNIQTAGLAKRVEHTKINKAVIGISGGLDSTLALLVTIRVFDLLNISRENIIAITMPGFGTTDITYTNAVSLIKEIGATLKIIDIKKACSIHFEDIEHNTEIHDVTYENVQARERTQLLMDIANKVNGMVIGTGDLSELALGWCTYNGDHMSMYSVNTSIPKTLVLYLVKWVASNVFDNKTSEILLSVINTPISPELLPPMENGEIRQKTEETIGPYELHDFFLYYFLRFGSKPKKIVFLAKNAFGERYDLREIRKWLKVFLKRFFSQQFKRSCLPDGPKVGSVSLSPRGDWRMPSDVEGDLWIKELEEDEL